MIDYVISKLEIFKAVVTPYIISWRNFIMVQNKTRSDIRYFSRWWHFFEHIFAQIYFQRALSTPVSNVKASIVKLVMSEIQLKFHIYWKLTPKLAEWPLRDQMALK